MDFFIDLLKIEIFGPLIAVIDFIVSIIVIAISDDPKKRKYMAVQFFAVLFIITVLLYYKKSQATIIPPGSQVVSVEGFYEAFPDDGLGYMTLKIKEREINGGNIPLECTISDSGGMRYALGRFEPEQSNIYIPGFGNGIVEKDQDSKIFLKFFISGKELKFSQ